jgi:endonuclease YncB( thermonuclease family)
MTLRSVTFARLLFAAACLCAQPAFADNLTGQASVIDGDTLEIHGTRVRLWESTRPRAVSFVATMRACSTNAARRLRTSLTSSLRDGRSIARP